MLTGDDAHMDGVVAEILVSTPAISIAGGTWDGSVKDVPTCFVVPVVQA